MVPTLGTWRWILLGKWKTFSHKASVCCTTEGEGTRRKGQGTVTLLMDWPLSAEKIRFLPGFPFSTKLEFQTDNTKCMMSGITPDTKMDKNKSRLNQTYKYPFKSTHEVFCTWQSRCMVRWPQSSLMCDNVRPKTPSACVSNMLSAIDNYFISYMENVRSLLLLRILTTVPFF